MAPLHAPVVELSSVRVLQAESTSLLGNFRRPPLAFAGACYVVTTNGMLQEVTLAGSTRPRALAELPPAVASSRAAIVNLARLGAVQAGATFVGVHPGGVEAVILATGAIHTVHRATPDSPLAVNAADAGSSLCGVATDAAHFAFAEHSGTDRITLAVGSFTRREAAERVLVLLGSEVMGPVLCGGLLAVCTGQAAGVHDLQTQQSASVPLPRGFEPMLARRQGGVNVAPGSIPLSAERGPGGHVVFVAGHQAGASGLLTIHLHSGSSSFEPLGRGSSITSNPDGSLSVAAEDEIRILGNGSARREWARLQFAMPVVADAGFLLMFDEEHQRGLQRMVLTAAANAGRQELTLEDAACTEVSCAAPLLCGASVALPYFTPTPQGDNGLKIAVWDLAHQ